MLPRRLLVFLTALLHLAVTVPANAAIHAGGLFTPSSSQGSGGFGISLCIPPLCYGASWNVSLAEQSIDHGYQSATGQTGIAAGTGGFDIGVGGHTIETKATLSGVNAHDAVGKGQGGTINGKDNQIFTGRADANGNLVMQKDAAGNNILDANGNPIPETRASTPPPSSTREPATP